MLERNILYFDVVGFSTDQTLEKQANKLRDICSKYEHDQKSWKVAINSLEQKVKVISHFPITKWEDIVSEFSFVPWFIYFFCNVQSELKLYLYR